jgi:hypothetical protein
LRERGRGEGCSRGYARRVFVLERKNADESNPTVAAPKLTSKAWIAVALPRGKPLTPCPLSLKGRGESFFIVRDCM